MSLYKAIEHGKEYRKQYTDSRLIDSSCRNHGMCPLCAGNRRHKQLRQMPINENGKIIYSVKFCVHLVDFML